MSLYIQIMSIEIHIYICIYTYIHTYIHIYIYIYIQIHTYSYIVIQMAGPGLHDARLGVPQPPRAGRGPRAAGLARASIAITVLLLLGLPI